MPNRRWTPEEITDLLKMYPNPRISHEEMTGHFQRNWGTIKQKAQQLHLRRQVLRPWSEEEATLLRELYPDETISRDYLASVLGRTWRSVQHKIGELGLGLTRPRNNPCQVKRHFFQSINTNKKAYWLGFLAADGTVYIGGRQHTVCLDLQPRDLHWLTRFRDTIAPGAKITQHGDRSYSVSIGSQELVHDLVRLGITPRKSNTLAWPPIPEPFVIPFLLGYFDGDGSFTPRFGRRDYQWMLFGTLDFLQMARDYIQRYAAVELKEPVRANKHTSLHLYRISANGPGAPIIDRTLNASGLGMPRKHLPKSSSDDQ
jgi:hypothetical protein